MTRLVSWFASDPWFALFTLLQFFSFIVLGLTLAIGTKLAFKQNDEILVLKTNLSKQEELTAKAERELEELREHQRDRVLNLEAFEAALNGKPSGEVAILYDELAGVEGYSLASSIALAVQRANWKVSMFGPISSVADARIGFPAITQAGSYTGSGITIGVGILDFKQRPFTDETPYSTLWNAFTASGLKFDACIPADPLPLNSFRILVGKRPPLPCKEG